MSYCSKLPLFIFSIFILALISPVLADEYIIINTETGLVLDVQGGANANDITVWQFASNSSRAQAFEIRTLNGITEIMPKTGPGLVLEAESPIELQRHSSTTGGGPLSPSVKQRTKIDLSSSEFTTIFSLNAAREKQKHQQWKLIPVEGETDTYYIKNLAYGENKALAALAAGPRAVVKLVDVSSNSRTKWKLDRLNQNAPTKIRLQTIRYKSGRVEGSLFWDDQSDSEARYQVTLFRNGDDASETQFLPRDSDRLDFSFDIDEASKDQRHCLTVSAQREHYRTFEGVSNSACGRAYKKKVGPCGKWVAHVEIIVGSGVKGTGSIEEPFTGCVIFGKKVIRIREDRSVWTDKQLITKTLGEEEPFEIFYECKAGENVGRVFTEIKVDGKTVARSPNDHDVANCR